MTDSMKFGPEWLRNMSADNTNACLLSGGGSTGGGNLSLKTGSSTNDGNIGGQHSFGLTSNILSPSGPISARSTFPEFRYGREEMLSLFDKKYNMPDILPQYKKIFVEKVQLPLALTPSTCEELLPQVSSSISQRTFWMQRSPVSSNGSTRGNGRGGSVDRGRLRGKSNYQTYQRPIAILDENSTRSGTLKIDRGWPERNGSGDSLNVGVGCISGFGFNSEWNSTPTTSPRKEFSSHPRNMENWRRNRNEDSLVDNSTCGGNIEGWRGSNSNDINFAGNNRWGRSTSWREEDVQSGSTSEVCYGSGITIQRSYSTITTVNERGYMGVNSHGSHICQASTRALCSLSLLNSPSVRKSQWKVSNSKFNTSGADIDDVLPEWAMENPSDGGGSFDAHGAFHGSAEGRDNRITSQCQKSTDLFSGSLASKKKDNNVLGNKSGTSPEMDKSSFVFNTNKISENSIIEQSIDLPEEIPVKSSTVSQFSQDIHTVIPLSQAAEDDTGKSDFIKVNEKNNLNVSSTFNIQTGLSERMQEVADDMIEKLIMDDEIKSNPCGILESPMAAAVQKAAPTSVNKPPLADSGIHHFSDRLIVDHATSTYYQQQLASNSNVPKLASLDRSPHVSNCATSTDGSDLWYYRDPQYKVQGPFTANEMSEWYRAGYFNGNLYVRRLCDTHFRSLGELIRLCNDNMPFTHGHLIPSFNSRHLSDNTMPTTSTQKLLSTEDYDIKQKSHQEELIKGNDNSEVDFSGNNDKNRVVSIDNSNTYFQFLRHQEILLHNNFFVNKCFQQLTPSEKNTVLRQGLEMRTDCGPNLSNLNNSIAVDFSVKNELYDVIDRSKTDSLNQWKATQCFRQASYFNPKNFEVSSPQSEPFSTCAFGIMTGDKTNEENFDIVNNCAVDGLLSNLGMRMFSNTAKNQSSLIPNPKHTDFNPRAEIFNNSELLSAGKFFLHNNNLLHSWQTPAANQTSQHQSPSEWENSLVGIPMPIGTSANIAASMERENNQSKTQQQEPLPISLWELSQIDKIKPRKQVESKACNLEKNNFNREEQPIGVAEAGPQAEDLPTDKPVAHTKIKRESSTQLAQPSTIAVTGQIDDEFGDKSFKEVGAETGTSQNEEECRRDQTEDKRRQKDEKKRQRHTDEEQYRQMPVQRGSQQEIEFQNRKVVLGGNKLFLNSGSASLASATILSSKATKEQLQSSVAPWSAQTSAISTKSPCLAEIQKAEIRERQVETYVKRVRAGAAAPAEGLDSIVKWNAPIKEVPVKSFVEIQAEEAKQLANKQMGTQRRKEQELQQGVPIVNTSSNPLSINISSIWSGEKVWGSNTVGFWEEPSKFNTATAANNCGAGPYLTTVITTNSNSKTTTVASKQTIFGQIKSESFNVQNASQPQCSSARNLRKNKSIPLNAAPQYGKYTKINQQHCNPSKQVHSKKKAYKFEANDVDDGTGGDKKTTTSKSYLQSPGGSSTTTSKRDNFENDFIAWCTKSLNNMNTKLDVPTFVTFLRDLESPYEVKDYIRMYIGENRESSDFSKQFLERRSMYKNLQRAQNAHNDDMCKPAPAITPSGNENYEYKAKPKKVKKNKMTKMDTRILGFSVTAAEGRTNVGDRAYVDAP